MRQGWCIGLRLLVQLRANNHLLDRIQKKLPISKEEYRILKKKELVEGRYPNINISVAGASAIDKKAEYTNAKGF